MNAATSRRGEMDTSARVKALYYIMQSMEGKLGGGEGIEGLYGSITRSGMQKVLDCLCCKCCLAQDSHVVDIGAGLGRPLLHALVTPGVASGFGIEIDRIKCDKAAAFLKHSLTELGRRGGGSGLAPPRVQCSSIEKIKTLEPGTHAYSFWEGVPTEGKIAFGKLFAGCPTMKSVAVVQRAMRGKDPAEEMQEMGFGTLKLVGTFPVSMSGSGRSFTAYVFNKEGHGASLSPLQPAPSVVLPPTPAAGDKRRNSVDSVDTGRRGQAQQPAAVPAEALEPQAVVPPVAGEELQQPYPSTPTMKPSKRPDSPLATPLSSLKGRLAGLPATPKSTGISGVPRRVSLSPKASSHQAAAGGEGPPFRAPTRPAAVRQSRLAVSRAAAEPVRRSTRLKGQENAALGAGNSSPAALPAAPTSTQKVPTRPKGVQKARSPQKNTLETAGFRSRRSAAEGAGKAKGALNFPGKAVGDKASIQPRGLGAISQQVK